MIRAWGGALLAIGLTACAGPGAEPDVGSSSSPAAAATSSPTETSTPKLAPPKVRFEKAVSALRRSEPLLYDYVLSDSGGAVVSAFGTWDPETGSASLQISFSNPLRPNQTRVGGKFIVVGEAWYGELGNHCWIRAHRDTLAKRYGVTEDTFGLTAADALAEAQVTGESPGSAEVLELDFELDRVLAMLARPDLEPTRERVHGQVTVLDGQVTKWTIEGADLAESLAPDVSPHDAQAVSYFDLEMTFAHGRTDVIRRPPRDKLAPDLTTTCRAAGRRQV